MEVKKEIDEVSSNLSNGLKEVKISKIICRKIIRLIICT